MDWYQGPTLLEHLESVDVARKTAEAFRFPVQSVNRSDAGYRGCSGTVRGGSIRPGDTVRFWPSHAEARVDRIIANDGDISEAVSGDAVTLVLDRDVDVSRGDLITRNDEAAVVFADQLQATVIWVGDEKLVPERRHSDSLQHGGDDRKNHDGQIPPRYRYGGSSQYAYARMQ